MFCNRCGHKNPDGANFCSSCGGILERPSEGDPITITLEPVPGEPEEEIVVPLDGTVDGGVLVVKRGPDVGARFGLGSETTTIGRHPASGIFLDDVTVSRRHAEVSRNDDGSYGVRDVGSLNGTYLNRERIEGAAALHNGDELQIGKFRLVFLTEASEA